MKLETPLLPTQTRTRSDSPFDNRPRDVLLTAIYERCVKHEQPVDHHRRSRLGTKGTCLVISAVAKVPYIPVSLQLPGGPAFAAGNIFSFFILEWWAVRATIEDLLGPRGQAETLLIERVGRGRCYQIAVITNSIWIGLFSQVPVALPLLDYDTTLKEEGFFTLLVASSLVPIRSLQLSIDKTFQTRALGEIGKKIEAVRIDSISLIQNYRHYFRRSPFDKKTSIISNLNTIRLDHDTNAYLTEVLNSPSSPQRNLILERLSLIIGSFLTASFEAAFAMYTWDKAKEHIADNDAVAATFAIVSGASWLYVTGTSVIRTTQRVAETFLNLITRRKDPSLAEQIHPKLVFALKSVGIISNLLALGSPYVIFRDFYHDAPPAERDFFIITVCVALLLLLSTATSDIVENYVEEQIERKGTLDHQNIIKLDKELRKLQNLFQQSSLLDFATFLLKSPTNLKQALTSRIAITIDELNEYIETQAQ